MREFQLFVMHGIWQRGGLRKPNPLNSHNFCAPNLLEFTIPYYFPFRETRTRFLSYHLVVGSKLFKLAALLLQIVPAIQHVGRFCYKSVRYAERKVI